MCGTQPQAMIPKPVILHINDKQLQAQIPRRDSAGRMIDWQRADAQGIAMMIAATLNEEATRDAREAHRR